MQMYTLTVQKRSNGIGSKSGYIQNVSVWINGFFVYYNYTFSGSIFSLSNQSTWSWMSMFSLAGYCQNFLSLSTSTIFVLGNLSSPSPRHAPLAGVHVGQADFILFISTWGRPGQSWLETSSFKTKTVLVLRGTEEMPNPPECSLWSELGVIMCLSDSSKAYFYSYSLLRRLSFPYLHTERVTTKYSSSSSSSFSSSPSFQLILIFLYLFYLCIYLLLLSFT